jgi:tetratricopeptide (TPR) repeat protein
VVLQFLERHEKAIECYDTALEIDPSDADALSFKGYNLELLNKFDEAIECFESALNIEPNHPYAEIRMRIILRKLEF